MAEKEPETLYIVQGTDGETLYIPEKELPNYKKEQIARSEAKTEPAGRLDTNITVT